MISRYCAIVWINHNAAEIFRINAIEESKLVVNSHTSQQSLHHRRHVDGGGHHPVDVDYFERIASTLNHVEGTLLAGSGEARFELGRYLGQARPDLASHIHKLDTPNHPGDAGLVALARDYFHLST
jgi:stalled ribosome rescue protein Dom34